MKYRSRTDIVAQVLNAANGGTTKTKIMYSAYMSYAQLKDYLSTLVQSGLLEVRDTEYRTTPKGFEFLHSYNQISGMLEKIESFPDTGVRKTEGEMAIRAR